MNTAAQNKSILDKLIELFQKLQIIKPELWEQHYQEAKIELQKKAEVEAKAKTRKLKAELKKQEDEAKKKHAAGAAAAGLGLGSYSGSYHTKPETVKAKKLKVRVEPEEPSVLQIQQLAQQKYIKALPTDSWRELDEVMKRIDFALLPSIQNALLTYDRAKNTLLAADWRQIREQFPIEKIFQLNIEGWIERTIDTIEFIKADISLSQPDREQTKEDKGKESKQKTTKEKLPAESRVLAILAQHPDWSNTKIAKEAGVSRPSLYKMETFLRVRELQKKEGKKKIPRGSKDGETSKLEAWDNKSKV